MGVPVIYDTNIKRLFVSFLKNFTDYSGSRKQTSSADFETVICALIYLLWDYTGIVKVPVGKGTAMGLQHYIAVILDVSFMGCYAVLSGKSYGGAREV
jgi:hypothetical protein